MTRTYGNWAANTSGRMHGDATPWELGARFSGASPKSLVECHLIEGSAVWAGVTGRVRRHPARGDRDSSAPDVRDIETVGGEGNG